jgi:hypothetical protein
LIRSMRHSLMKGAHADISKHSVAGNRGQAVLWLEWDNGSRCATSRLPHPPKRNKKSTERLHGRIRFHGRPREKLQIREAGALSAEYPTQAQKRGLTRISCTWHQATAACAAFVEESRMKFINANKLHRKSGGMGHSTFVAGAGDRNDKASVLLQLATVTENYRICLFGNSFRKKGRQAGEVRSYF